ncbi:MAG: S8 family serine peptidase [Rhizobiaceae bacterium]|nr:S8 family serine peptidase [Rhizobiaceae bacterium]
MTSIVSAKQDQIIADVWGATAARRGADEVAGLKRFSFTPGFGAVVDADDLAKLARHPAVTAIHADDLAAPTLNSSLTRVQAQAAWAAGATGTGAGGRFAVAVLDSGVRRTHEFFAGRYIAAACFNTRNTQFNSFSQCPGGVGASTAITSANDCNPATIFGCGHGTHVAGTAVGTNGSVQGSEPRFGVARAGAVVAVNVFSRFVGTNCGSSGLSQGCILAFTSDQIKGLEFSFQRRNTLRIAAVNMSLGGGRFFSPCTTDSRRPIIQALRNNRVATIIAAGNDGFSDSVGAPACIPEAVTVAASFKTPGPVNIVNFSNWDDQVDLVAPGVEIIAPVPNSNTAYGSKSGTSMATPHVAGAFVALRARRPAATVTQIENALKATGQAVTCCSDGTVVTRRDIRIRNAINVMP